MDCHRLQNQRFESLYELRLEITVINNNNNNNNNTILENALTCAENSVGYTNFKLDYS
jgi:hypothetical protein